MFVVVVVCVAEFVCVVEVVSVYFRGREKNCVCESVCAWVLCVLGRCVCLGVVCVCLCGLLSKKGGGKLKPNRALLWQEPLMIGSISLSFST